MCATVLGFASIVLRVKRPPLLQLESVSVNYLSYATSPSPSFDLTMFSPVNVRNQNFERFDYGNNGVTVFYGDCIVGERELRSSRVKGRENRAMNVSLNLRSDKVLILSSGNLTTDMLSGALNLTAYTKLIVIVHLLKFLKKKTSIPIAGIMRLNLNSNSVQNLQC